jgi:N-acetylglucosamine-6-phosphate deacetylase
MPFKLCCINIGKNLSFETLLAAMKYYTNARVFVNNNWLHNASVTVKGGRIDAINAVADKDATVIDCGGNLLIPALLDLQLYGAGGRLFSAYPDPLSLQKLAEENKKAGVAACLATIATQPLPVIYECIEGIKHYWQQGGRGILGMHLEGPFMNPVKRGAHNPEWIHAPSVKEVEDLLTAGKDVIKVVTLAPECCDEVIVKMFVDAGVYVSAGHSNATYKQAEKFSAQGITLVTHMFNAMSALHHRDTGLPGAAFEDKKLTASIIPDGIHVSYSALKIAKQQMGERLFFITDSVTETNIGAYQHRLNNDHYCTADGTLSGSAITLLQGVKNANLYAGIRLEECIRMASLYPAKAIGIQKDYGSISPGRIANMLLVNKDLELLENFIE